MAFNPLQQNHLYSVFFAPRGSRRMAQLGMQLAQLHLSPFDHLIGVMGDAGSGKSLLIKGMLVDTDSSITEIADQVGFESIAYFERVFKKLTGERPLQFRKKYQ